MQFPKDIYDAAIQTLDERRTKAQQQAAALRARVVEKIPRVAEIEAALADTGAKLSRAILAGGDIEAAVAAIKEENLTLQGELAVLLKKAGVPAVNFEPQYTCPVCSDNGYAGGKMCACLAQLLREKAAASVCKGLADTPARFEDMDLSFYDDTVPTGRTMSPRKRMALVIAYCKQYAETFSKTAPSLLLRGPTGTGKTHASLAMASAIAANGFSVIYQPAGKLFRTLEREHFGKQEGDTETLALTCDLLVIDDLGTEFDTGFTVATLYNILNTRILDELPTIISTNLTQEGIQQRYGDQITSRITGSFEPLLFVGKDIRQQKRERAIANG
ncbi:MAG: ATP-binding protein [Clostridia bacterium]|nr:ATP-binding protein [Clostridia bacterium]